MKTKKKTSEENISDRSGSALMRAGMIMLIMAFITSYACSCVIAGHVISDGRTDSARVAAVSLSGGAEVIDLAGSISGPGDSADITLICSGASELPLSYRIGIELNGSMPVESTLISNSSGKKLISTDLSDLNAAIVNDSMPLTAVSAPLKACTREDASDTYTLHLEWPESENDPGYSDGRSVLKVLTIAEKSETGELSADHHGYSADECMLEAAGFHFSSDQLDAAGAKHDTGGVFSFDLCNYETENAGQISEKDCSYRLKVCSEGKALDKERITVRCGDMILCSDEDGSYMMPGDGLSKALHRVTVDAGDIAKPGGYCHAPETRISVRAVPDPPNAGTLSAVYTIRGLEVNTEPVGGGISSLVIDTNMYEGPLRIRWCNDAFPAAGVNEHIHGWNVHYSGEKREACRQVRKNSRYCFEYFDAAGAPVPDVSGNWDSAVINAGI